MRASLPIVPDDRKHRETATGHASRQRRVSDEWTLVEFRPARWLLTALTVLALWLVSPNLGKRGLLDLAWQFAPSTAQADCGRRRGTRSRRARRKRRGTRPRAHPTGLSRSPGSRPQASRSLGGVRAGSTAVLSTYSPASGLRPRRSSRAVGCWPEAGDPGSNAGMHGRRSLRLSARRSDWRRTGAQLPVCSAFRADLGYASRSTVARVR